MPLSFKEIQVRRVEETQGDTSSWKQAKLEALQYENMTALESDLKRMVQNAKEYNATGSRIYEDAERIRKAISNFMPKHNPAYRDEEYRAIATPIPNSEEHSMDEAPSPKAPVTLRLRVNGANRQDSVKTESENGDSNMQEVQLEVVDEMIGLRDPEFVAMHPVLCVTDFSRDDEVEITNEFFEKPPKRAYPDYYQQISHPTALKDIRKTAAAGKFADWPAFITEVEYLWNNALAYNEDESFIYGNAIKLRVSCPRS